MFWAFVLASALNLTTAAPGLLTIERHPRTQQVRVLTEDAHPLFAEEFARLTLDYATLRRVQSHDRRRTYAGTALMVSGVALFTSPLAQAGAWNNNVNEGHLGRVSALSLPLLLGGAYTLLYKRRATVADFYRPDEVARRVSARNQQLRSVEGALFNGRLSRVYWRRLRRTLVVTRDAMGNPSIINARGRPLSVAQFARRVGDSAMSQASTGAGRRETLVGFASLGLGSVMLSGALALAFQDPNTNGGPAGLLVGLGAALPISYGVRVLLERPARRVGRYYTQAQLTYLVSEYNALIGAQSPEVLPSPNEYKRKHVDLFFGPNGVGLFGLF